MKILIRLTVLCSLLFISTISFAQHTDSMIVMSYNVGNYGNTKGGCPLQTPSKKNPYLRTILKYVNPDIVGFVKMYNDPTFDTSTVIHTVLDTVCAACWGHSTYTNKSGYKRNNILYFKKSKFGFINTTTLYSADINISDINMHKLYYKSPTLSSTHDTVFLYIILVHDLSGGSAGTDRTTELSGAMKTLKSMVSKAGNYIFMGDFNTSSSLEGCYQAMIDSTNGNTRFYDPISMPGNWQTYPYKFAKYLTNTSRTTDPGDCLATGGLSDRFDHILCTAPIINGLDSIQYINNSYTVLGNDGGHVGKSVYDAPNTSGVPAIVDTALYFMSEHLPVISKFRISRQYGSGISSIAMSALSIKYNTLVSDKVNIQILSNTPFGVSSINIFNLQGQLVKTFLFSLSAASSIPVQNLPQGTYIWQLIQNHTVVFNGRFVKIN